MVVGSTPTWRASFTLNKVSMVVVAELVNAPDCESGFLRVQVPSITPLFEYTTVAQLVEQTTDNRLVIGSNPIRGTNILICKCILCYCA